MYAAHREDAFHFLVENGASIEDVDYCGNTILYNCSLQVCRILCEGGINVNAKNYDGDTALYATTLEQIMDRNYSTDKFRTLIAFGADSSIMISQGGSSVDIISSIEDSCYWDHKIIISELWHDSPLHTASYNGDLDEVASILGTSDDRVDSELIDSMPRGWSALHVAVFMNRREVVELLVRKGSSLHLRVVDGGFTAFHLACLKGYVDIITSLVMKKS